MIRTILTIVVLTSFAAAAALKADPSPSTDSSSAKNKKESSKTTTPRIVPVAPLKQGWSLVNGVWTHSDGYKFVNGHVQRVGTQTHTKPPKPPTKTEMDAALKKPSTKTPADAAAAKAAERERNLMPSRPASQTGTHL